MHFNLKKDSIMDIFGEFFEIFKETVERVWAMCEPQELPSQKHFQIEQQGGATIGKCLFQVNFKGTRTITYCPISNKCVKFIQR